ALEDIQARMETEGEKLGQVVVNLSLVITPADEEIAGLWYGDDCCCHAEDLASMMNEVKLLRLGLHMVIKSLTADGAVVVAPAGAKTWAIVTDAVIGVYSSPNYSMLSASDLPPENYHAPGDSNAWAYWSGTSFATPIISAVAARVLQGLKSSVISSGQSFQDI